MSGGKSGMKAPKWVPNPLYCPPEPLHADSIAEMLEGADQVVAVSTVLLGNADIERAVEFYRWDRPRYYVLTSAPPMRGRVDGQAAEARSHAESLDALKGKVLIRTPNHFRSSIVLSRSGRDKSGLLYTGNMGAEGPGGGHELLVKLTRPEVTDLLSVFRWAFWEGATHEYSGGLKDCRPLGKVEFPVTKNVILLGPRHASLRDEALNVLGGSPRAVASAGFGWGSDPEVAGRLRQLSGLGTRVSMAVDLAESARGAAGAIRDGIRVAGVSGSCAKALVADSRALVTVRGRSTGGAFEIGLVIGGSRAAGVKRTLNEWVENFQYGIG